MAVRIIKKQRKQLDDVQSYTWRVICQAKKEMSNNLPRGTWALWKGRLEVAKNVFELVRVHWEAALLDFVGKMGGL